MIQLSFSIRSAEILSKVYRTLSSDDSEQILAIDMTQLAQGIYSSTTNLDLGIPATIDGLHRRSMNQRGYIVDSGGFGPGGGVDRQEHFKSSARIRRFRSFSMRKCDATPSQPLLSYKTWATPRRGETFLNIPSDNRMADREELLVTTPMRGRRCGTCSPRGDLRSMSSSSPSVNEREERENREKSKRGFQQAAAALVIGQFGSLRLDNTHIFNETEL